MVNKEGRGGRTFIPSNKGRRENFQVGKSPVTPKLPHSKLESTKTVDKSTSAADRVDNDEPKRQTVANHNDEPKRQTVANRMSDQLLATTDKTGDKGLKEDVAGNSGLSNQNNEELEKVTQRLKNVTMAGHKLAENSTIETRKGPFHLDDRIREYVFYPQWETHIGQLQATCASLRRYSPALLANNGSVIVRCYPEYNMHYMFNASTLIFTVARNELMEDAAQMNMIHQPHEEYRIFYDDAGKAWELGARMLINVRFRNDILAQRFILAYNQMIRHLYSNDMSMRSYKPPFAHADLTMPERRLRVALQKLTREKNEASGGRRGFDPRTESVRQYWGETYYHDGINLLKRASFSNALTEVVKMDDSTELQHLQVMALTLRKYARLVQQKRMSAIIQGIEVATSGSNNDLVGSKEDREKIEGIIHKVILTDEYRKLVPGATKAVIKEFTRVQRRKDVNAAMESTDKGHYAPPPLVRVTFCNEIETRAFLKLFRQLANVNEQEENPDEPSTSASHQVKRLRRMRAHRDLTPPELALHYAMRDFCRKKNEAEKEETGGKPKKYFFVRNMRVYEKTLDESEPEEPKAN